MPEIPQNRLVRKEVALGTLRELEPPQSHIGLRMLAPFQDVASDDVIFDYAKGLTDGLVPARAEDAESELAQKDITSVGVGRASIIDWAEKDHYSASDVTRYRENVLVAANAGVLGIPPLTVGSMVADFNSMVARDDARRRRKIDNRLEWLIMQSVETGGIAYNDGKVSFAVNWARPTNQTDQAPASGTFDLSTSDPIGEIMAIQEYMFDLYGVRMTRAITSRKVMNSFINSDRFLARNGLVVGGTPSAPIDPRYIVDGWGPNFAAEVVERQTNVAFTVYDSVYRTRNVGSNTVTNNRFLSENKIYLLPAEDDINELEEGMLGFGKTLSSPHPEGNWTPGFYEWERDTVDPWGTDRGTGIKAFPVFPHMDLTYTLTALP